MLTTTITKTLSSVFVSISHVELLHAHVHDPTISSTGSRRSSPLVRLPVVLAAALDDADLGRLDALDAGGHVFSSGSRRAGASRASVPEPWASKASRGASRVRARAEPSR